MALQDSISPHTGTATRVRCGVRSIAAWALACWFVSACSSEKVVLGEQCPSPLDSRATIDPGMAVVADAGTDAGVPVVYGTSCAPCEGSKPRLDSRGCPIFVTFESCGGDICFGSQRVTRSEPDVDAGSTDAGDMDAGDAPEDAGDQG
jgi:hypothetical protein